MTCATHVRTCFAVRCVFHHATEINLGFEYLRIVWIKKCRCFEVVRIVRENQLLSSETCCKLHTVLCATYSFDRRIQGRCIYPNATVSQQNIFLLGLSLAQAGLKSALNIEQSLP